MRMVVWFSALGVLAMSFSGCSQPAPAKTDFRLIASIGEIMKSIVDPGADDLWNSVATIVTAAGEENKAPRTPEEWEKVRHDAIGVIEAMNLIVMEGRTVAKPGAKSENPGIELEPAEIEKLIAADRPALFTLAHAEQDAASAALAAIDRKDVDGLLDAGEKMDTACENCHLKYWYPNDSPSKRAKFPTVGAAAQDKPAAPSKP